MSDQSEQSSNLKRIYGIVDLDDEIVCSHELLGHIEVISIGGVEGLLKFPQLPCWPPPNPEDPHLLLLTGPDPAQKWKRGDPIYWGRQSQYPKGSSRLMRLLIEFSVNEAEEKLSANKIAKKYSKWMSLFVDYFELITKQKVRSRTSIVNSMQGVDLICWNADGTTYEPHDSEPIQINLMLDSGKSDLTVEQLVKICKFSSSGVEPEIEYQVQLEAYRALRSNDFRKAIVETAVAAEIVLTKAILTTFNNSRVSYGEKMLDKFRMLGGRLDLAKAIGVNLPDADYKSILIEPRNNVIHRAHFANVHDASKAIRLVDDLLKEFSPEIGRAI